MQKRIPGAFAFPQAGQACASTLPQLPQNFASALFSTPQLEHCIVRSLRPPFDQGKGVA
jgi:hypothetical protein